MAPYFFNKSRIDTQQFTLSLHQPTIFLIVSVMNTSLSFIFGDETLLVENHVNRLIAQAPQAEKHVFTGVFSFADCFNALNSSNLFCPQSLIHIQSPWFFSKVLDKKDAAAFDLLIQTALSSPHTVIVSHQGSLDQRKKTVTSLKKAADTHVYQAFKDWEQDKVIDWIKQSVSTHKKTIDTPAIWALTEIGGTNIRQISNEIEKLVVYIGHQTAITKQDVMALSAGANGSAYQLSEALKNRQQKGVIQLVKRLIDHGDDPLRILGLIASNIRLYIQISSAKKDGLSTDSLAKLIGKNPYFLKRLAPEITKHYTLEDLLFFQHQLSKVDVAIKSGKQKPLVSLESALLKAV